MASTVMPGEAKQLRGLLLRPAWKLGPTMRHKSRHDARQFMARLKVTTFTKLFDNGRKTAYDLVLSEGAPAALAFIKELRELEEVEAAALKHKSRWVTRPSPADQERIKQALHGGGMGMVFGPAKKRALVALLDELKLSPLSMPFGNDDGGGEDGDLTLMAYVRAHGLKCGPVLRERLVAQLALEKKAAGAGASVASRASNATATTNPFLSEEEEEGGEETAATGDSRRGDAAGAPAAAPPLRQGGTARAGPSDNPFASDTEPGDDDLVAGDVGGARAGAADPSAVNPFVSDDDDEGANARPDGGTAPAPADPSAGNPFVSDDDDEGANARPNGGTAPAPAADAPPHRPPPPAAAATCAPAGTDRADMEGAAAGMEGADDDPRGTAFAAAAASGGGNAAVATAQDDDDDEEDDGFGASDTIVPDAEVLGAMESALAPALSPAQQQEQKRATHSSAITQHLKSALRDLVEAGNIGQEVLLSLDEQRDMLLAIKHHVTDIDHHMNKADKAISEMESPFWAAFGLVRTKKSSFLPTGPVLKESAAGRPKQLQMAGYVFMRENNGLKRFFGQHKATDLVPVFVRQQGSTLSCFEDEVATKPKVKIELDAAKLRRLQEGEPNHFKEPAPDGTCFEILPAKAKEPVFFQVQDRFTYPLWLSALSRELGARGTTSGGRGNIQQRTLGFTQEQDQLLDQIGNALDDVHEVALHIGREMDDQADLVAGATGEVARANSRVHEAKDRMDDIYHTQ